MNTAAPSVGSKPERRPSALLSLLLLILGSACIAASGKLIYLHAATLKQVQEDVLPLAAQVTSEESRLSILRKQVEATKLAAAPRTGSLEEKLHMYTFPPHAAPDHMLTLLNLVFDTLQKDGKMKDLSAITVGDPLPVALNASGALVNKNDAALQSRTFSFSFTATQDGTRDVLSFVDLSGLLIVQDALDDAQLSKLLTITEADNPTGVVALGTFLSTDLLTYMHDPKLADERLRGSFSSDAFMQELQKIIESSFFLTQKAFAQGNLVRAIQAAKSWPLPFLSLQSIQTEDTPDGWMKVSLTLRSYAQRD